MPEVLFLRDGGVLAQDEHALLTLAQWQANDAGDAVALQPDEDCGALRAALPRLRLIALDFPKPGDGRAYSIATLLRQQGYRAELRATGAVQIDQLFFLRRVGFDSVAALPQWRDDAARTAIRAALSTFSDAYQGAQDQPLPAYRRYLRPSADERSSPSPPAPLPLMRARGATDPRPHQRERVAPQAPGEGALVSTLVRDPR